MVQRQRLWIAVGNRGAACQYTTDRRSRQRIGRLALHGGKQAVDETKPLSSHHCHLHVDKRAYEVPFRRERKGALAVHPDLVRLLDRSAHLEEIVAWRRC